MEKGEKIIKKVKRILFLSADDFKEKSIQVIRKTPEAYVKGGWEVTYVVLRDNSNKGNYYYEKPFDIEGARIVRKNIPGTRFLNSINNKYLSSIVIRIRRYLSIIYLIYYGADFLKNTNFDILYGYEQPGAVAAKFLKQIGFAKKSKLVLRFQGVVFVKEWLKRNKWYRKITNFDTYYALKGPSHLCIMTNDGSQGDWVLSQIKAKHKEVAFWSNGVDNFILDNSKESELIEKYKPNGEYLIVSVSRLDDHKRVDRCIRFFDKLVKSNSDKRFRYLIVGEGAKRGEFEGLVANLELEDHINFLGAVNQSEVPFYIGVADAFISMYESSNVGNPLLEAIRLNKLIITLDNGGTGDWIQHKKNGLIYPVNDSKDLFDNDYELMKTEFLDLLDKPLQIDSLKKELKALEDQKLWSWEKRFDAELEAINKLIS